MTGFHSKQDMAASKLQDGKCKWCIDGCVACDARAKPAQDVDYWIREATAARQAEMAMRRELEAQPQRQWIWLSDADIAEVVDTTCQYTGSYEEYLIKKAERKIRSMNNE
jgi:hypothetical protein